MSETVYICEAEKCDVVCIQNHCCKPHGCKGKPHCFFKATTKYQITEVLEPGYYLELELPTSWDQAKEFAKLYGRSSSEVKIINTYSENYDIILHGTNRQHRVHKSWIKQKQPEPTREELQIRLDSIVGYVVGEFDVTSESTNIINRLANGKP